MLSYLNGLNGLNGIFCLSFFEFFLDSRYILWIDHLSRWYEFKKLIHKLRWKVEQKITEIIKYQTTNTGDMIVIFSGNKWYFDLSLKKKNLAWIEPRTEVDLTTIFHILVAQCLLYYATTTHYFTVFTTVRHHLQYYYRQHSNNTATFNPPTATTESSISHLVVITKDKWDCWLDLLVSMHCHYHHSTSNAHKFDILGPIN